MTDSQKFKNKYRITSHRLKNYDYSSSGAYFVTICTKNREYLFGEIVNGIMTLNEFGGIAEKCWKKIQDHFPDVVLDRFVIIPNHVHGILFLLPSLVETKNFLSLQNPLNNHGTRRTIGLIIRGFKIGVTKYVRDVHAETNNDLSLPVVWQPNYHDRIIRNKDELNRIREYIFFNPDHWDKDNLND